MEILFRRPELDDRETILKHLSERRLRGCERTFANFYLWARIYNEGWAEIEGTAVFRTGPEGAYSYTYPIGDGDRKKVVELLMQDAQEKGYPFQLHALSTEDMNELEPLQEKGVQIKKLTDQITEYLASLFSAGTMTEQQAAQTASLMYILSDVERMGTLSVEVAKCVREKVDNRYKYTPEAMDELQKSLKTLEKMFNDSLKALQGDESVQIEKLIKRKDKIMDLDLKMRKAHVQRVNKGKCKASLTAPFTNILHLIDRMGNSCVNLADVASNEISLNYFMVN